MIRAVQGVTNGRYEKRYYLMGRNQPVFLGGYSYPVPVRSGQTESLVDPAGGMKGDDRARCVIHGGRDNTTVNGICLNCQTTKKVRPV
jgi:hypothetical protein